MNDENERSVASAGSQEPVACKSCGAKVVEGYDLDGVMIRIPLSRTPTLTDSERRATEWAIVHADDLEQYKFKAALASMLARLGGTNG